MKSGKVKICTKCVYGIIAEKLTQEFLNGKEQCVEYAKLLEK